MCCHRKVSAFAHRLSTGRPGGAALENEPLRRRGAGDERVHPPLPAGRAAAARPCQRVERGTRATSVRMQRLQRRSHSVVQFWLSKCTVFTIVFDCVVYFLCSYICCDHFHVVLHDVLVTIQFFVFFRSCRTQSSRPGTTAGVPPRDAERPGRREAWGVFLLKG